MFHNLRKDSLIQTLAKVQLKSSSPGEKVQKPVTSSILKKDVELGFSPERVKHV